MLLEKQYKGFQEMEQIYPIQTKKHYEKLTANFPT